MVVEDLGLPFGEGPSEATDFLYPVVSASGDGFVQQQSRVVWVIGEVDISYRFFRGSSEFSGE